MRLSKRHRATGHHGVSCFHHLRVSDPPLNPMECGIIRNGEVHDPARGMARSTGRTGASTVVAVMVRFAVVNVTIFLILG